jgi:hypothetical protein
VYDNNDDDADDVVNDDGVGTLPSNNAGIDIAWIRVIFVNPCDNYNDKNDR